MRITEEQTEYLNSFHCERLSSSPENEHLVKSFSNAKNPVLASQLADGGWRADTAGDSAYYVVKDTDGDIVLYFSLKCCSAFEMINEEQLKSKIQDIKNAKYTLMHSNNPDEKEKARLELEKDWNIILARQSDIRDYLDLKNLKLKGKDILEGILEDRKSEPNEHINYVLYTSPGIDIENFATNDNYKAKWRADIIPHPKGKVMFWRFIAPTIISVQGIVGCKYAMLFAADSTTDMTLVNYYEDLHFSRPDRLGTNKPAYDLQCIFMCQTLADLKANREEFFENFNTEPTLDAI